MKTLCALILLAFPLVSHASDADICYSKSVRISADQLTDKTKFDCPRAGKHTLPALVRDGWHVVSLQEEAVNGQATSVWWMLVIEKR